jgi:DNA modification methylase
METNKIIQGDVLEVLKTFEDESIDCIITSPPYYGLRDYGVEGQIGLEKTFEEYIVKLLEITDELKRVLKKTGTLWWNHGDSYNAGRDGGHPGGKKQWKSNQQKFQEKSGVNIQGMEAKCLLMQSYRLAIRMIDEQGWILRNQLIWYKPNCMPSSVKDRFTVDYEPIFFFTKSKKYWFETQYESLSNPERINFTSGSRSNGINKNRNDNDLGKRSKEFSFPQGRNKRCVWKITTQPYPEAHFAVFPKAIVETPIKAGCPKMICNKCGIAREKIYQYGKDIFGGGSGKAGRTKDDMAQTGKWQGKEVGRVKLGPMARDKKQMGYTDCDCKAGWKKGIVLDPFMGSGTTALVARQLGRDYVGIELNPEYIKIAEQRLSQQTLF